MINDISDMLAPQLPVIFAQHRQSHELENKNKTVIACFLRT